MKTVTRNKLTGAACCRCVMCIWCRLLVWLKDIKTRRLWCHFPHTHQKMAKASFIKEVWCRQQTAKGAEDVLCTALDQNSTGLQSGISWISGLHSTRLTDSHADHGVPSQTVSNTCECDTRTCGWSESLISCSGSTRKARLKGRRVSSKSDVSPVTSLLAAFTDFVCHKERETASKIHHFGFVEFHDQSPTHSIFLFASAADDADRHLLAAMASSAAAGATIIFRPDAPLTESLFDDLPDPRRKDSQPNEFDPLPLEDANKWKRARSRSPTPEPESPDWFALGRLGRGRAAVDGEERGLRREGEAKGCVLWLTNDGTRKNRSCYMREVASERSPSFYGHVVHWSVPHGFMVPRSPAKPFSISVSTTSSFL